MGNRVRDKVLSRNAKKIYVKPVDKIEKCNHDEEEDNIEKLKCPFCSKHDWRSRPRITERILTIVQHPLDEINHWNDVNGAYVEDKIETLIMCCTRGHKWKKTSVE